jgi:hypothetical protein
MLGRPYLVLTGVLFPLPSSSRTASASHLSSASLVPATRLAVDRHPVQLCHHPSQGTSLPSSIEGVAAPSSSSRRPRRRVGLHLRSLLPLRAGCHRPLWFDLLRVDRLHRELTHCSPVLTDPKFYSGSHWSKTSSTTASHRRLPCR